MLLLAVEVRLLLLGKSLAVALEEVVPAWYIQGLVGRTGEAEDARLFRTQSAISPRPVRVGEEDAQDEIPSTTLAAEVVAS